MAELMPVADPVTSPPSSDIERVQAFTREAFVLAGEAPDTALVPGSARRRAFDAALAELASGAEKPSVAWRREFSLLLGLERLLSVQEPTLVDGTLLSPHQVDALSGTLTALLAEGQGGAPGEAGAAHEGPLASAGIPGADELPEDLQEDEPEEEPQDWAADPGDDAPESSDAAADDPGASRRFWFEHATGAGKTVAALGFVEASRTGGTLILTHRRNLVDQFHGELRDRGYRDRIAPALLKDATGGDPHDPANGLVTVETYQWYVRNSGKVSDAYTTIICDEAHTALGEKTAQSIREWVGPVFIGMTATGALIARHVTDLFPTQTSRFDLASAARRGVIAPLRCVRIPPGPGVRTIAKVPLRRGDVDVEFDQELLAELLDQLPFNTAIADLYKTRFEGVPGVIYAAGVRHAYNVAEAFREVGLKARAVSGETPKRELAETLAAYERGDVDVLVNAQLLAEGWNSPRATVCMHLAPTASKRIYQQRVGRVTRRHLGKESGIVVDFVHPATKHDDPVVTLHSLLDRDVYRGGAIVVGPVRRGRGRRLRVERRVLPVAAEEDKRIEVFERELWRIAVEHLDYGEQIQWAALAGARVAPNGWRRARAMLHFDQGGELKRTFLLTAVQRNQSAQLRLRALQEIAAAKDAEALDRALDFIEGWPRSEQDEGVKTVLLALAEKKIGRRDQANNWIWRCANLTREVHEEYAVQRWPETKRLLGLLVNSSGGAHARNARRLVQSARQQDRRLSAALLAAAIPHTAEAGEVINGARTRMSRKPAALARELLRNFPKARKGRGAASRRRRKDEDVDLAALEEAVAAAMGVEDVEDEDEERDLEETEVEVAATGEDGEPDAGEGEGSDEAAEPAPVVSSGPRRVVIDDDFEAYSPEVTAADKDRPKRSRRGRGRGGQRRSRRPKPERTEAGDTAGAATPDGADGASAKPKPKRSRSRRRAAAAAAAPDAPVAEGVESTVAVPETPEAEPAKPRPRRTRKPPVDAGDPAAAAEAAPEAEPKPKRKRAAPKPKPKAKPKPELDVVPPPPPEPTELPKPPRRRRAPAKKPASGGARDVVDASEAVRRAVLDADDAA